MIAGNHVSTMPLIHYNLLSHTSVVLISNLRVPLVFYCEPVIEERLTN